MLNTECFTVTLSTESNVPSGYVDLYLINPGYETNGPHRLVDEIDNVVLVDIPQWNPRRGIFNDTILDVADVISAFDPAVYDYLTPFNGNGSVYPVPTGGCFGNKYDVSNFDPYFFTCSMIPSGSNLSTLPTLPGSNISWKGDKLGTVWVDTSDLVYIPYDDPYIVPTTTTRLHEWGQTIPGQQSTTYEWTISSYPPSMWESITQGYYDTVVDMHVSGTPKNTVYQRSRQQYTVVSPNINPLSPGSFTSFITLDILPSMSCPFQVDDYIIFTTSVGPSGNVPTLPTPLQPNTQYAVLAILGNNMIEIGDYNTHIPIALTDNGNMDLPVYAIPPFRHTDWVRNHTIVIDAFAGMLYQNTMPNPFEPLLLPLPENVLNDGDYVTVYINDQFITDSVQVIGGAIRCVSLGTALTSSDKFTILRSQHTVTPTEQTFNPEVSDTGSVLVQYMNYNEYSSYYTMIGNTLTPVYCFWVTGSTYPLQKNKNFTTATVNVTMKVNSNPYMVIQGLQQRASMDKPGQPTSYLPYRYDELIFRQISSYLTQDNRYTLELIENSTLRDNLKLDERSAKPKIHDLLYKYVSIPYC
jgi:hypothetical protein